MCYIYIGFRGFGPLTEAEQERLLSWEEYFGIDDYKDTWSQAEMEDVTSDLCLCPGIFVGDLVTECKEALTEILTVGDSFLKLGFLDSQHLEVVTRSSYKVIPKNMLHCIEHSQGVS